MAKVEINEMGAKFLTKQLFLTKQIIGAFYSEYS